MSLWLPAGSSADPTSRPTIFLDRDGVIIEDRGYVRDPRDVVAVPGAPEAMARARAAGWRLVGISNQSGIGRGLYGEADFAAVQARLDEILAAAGATLDALFYCPHAPEADCRCRKPRTGLLDEARARFAWAAGSCMVGDKLADVDLALAAGLRPFLVRTGEGARQEAGLGARAGVTVTADLPAAIAAVLGEGA